MAKNRNTLWINIKANAQQALTQLKNLQAASKQTMQYVQNQLSISGDYRGGRNRGARGLDGRRPAFTGFLGPGAFGPLGAAMGSFQVGGIQGMGIIGGLVIGTGIISSLKEAAIATKEFGDSIIKASSNFEELARIFRLPAGAVPEEQKFIEEYAKRFGAEAADKLAQNILKARGAEPALVQDVAKFAKNQQSSYDRFKIALSNFTLRHEDAIGFFTDGASLMVNSITNLTDTMAIRQAARDAVASEAELTGIELTKDEFERRAAIRQKQMAEAENKRRKNRETAIRREAEQAVEEARVRNRVQQRWENFEDQLVKSYQKRLEIEKENLKLAEQNNKLAQQNAANFRQRHEARWAFNKEVRNQIASLAGIPSIDGEDPVSKVIMGQFIASFGPRVGAALGAKFLTTGFNDGEQTPGFQAQTLNSAAEVYRRVNEAANSIPAKQLDELKNIKLILDAMWKKSKDIDFSLVLGLL